jgi:uncharacterized membrane protein YdbT with pleckstrin-like domain
MSYVRNFISPDEHILLLVHLHWIYLIEGLIWAVSLVLLGATCDYLLWTHTNWSVPFAGQEILGFYISAGTPLMLILLGCCGIFLAAVYFIKMFATEIALTNQRLILKTGLFFVEVEETDLVEIRAEHVHHGWFGRFLGYGRLKLDSRFVGDIYLPTINNPLRLVKVMHSARGKISDPMATE